MLIKVTEQRLHLVRWFLAVGWITMCFIAGAAQSEQDRYSPGKVVGDLGTLTKSVYSQTVIANSPKVPALVIAADRFDELLADDPGVARALLVSISQRLQAII